MPLSNNANDWFITAGNLANDYIAKQVRHRDLKNSIYHCSFIFTIE